MKKIYFLFVLCCLHTAAFSQLNTVTVNATGAAASYKTGYVNNSSPASRNDGDLHVHRGSLSPLNDQRGWAVFNVKSVMPPASTVTSVMLRFTISAVADTEHAYAVGIFGYNSSLAAVTDPDSLYKYCNGRGSFYGVNLCTTQWGNSTGTDLLALNNSGINFINTFSDTTVSLGWQCNSNPGQTYVITGETGSSITQPQLQIGYSCNGLTGISATVTPNPICANNTINLSGNVTFAPGRSATYSWTGPNSFTSTLQGPTLTATAAAAGVYTLVVKSDSGCTTTVLTPSITVNPVPAPIQAVAYLCKGSSTSISDVTTGGTWSVTPPAVATYNSTTHVITGVSPGTENITYTLSTGCYRSAIMTIVDTPTAITGNPVVCAGQFTILSDAGIGGTWSSANTAIATATPSNGHFFGVSMGITNVTYSVNPGCYATTVVQVKALAPITGTDSLCLGSNTFLADVVGGGAWSSHNTSIATVNPTSGQVFTVGAGLTTIKYTTTTGCADSVKFFVAAYPGPITGLGIACPGLTRQFSDATVGGHWSSANTSVATVNPNTGLVTGVFADTTSILYTVRPGCSTRKTIIVNPQPAPITGLDSIYCHGMIDSLFDATPNGIWSNTSHLVDTVDPGTGILTARGSGNDTIFYTLPLTTCSISLPVKVRAAVIPVITYNSLTSTFYTGTYYTSYQWHDSLQGLIPGATSSNVAALYSEYYYVVVIDSNGCTGQSALYHFDAIKLGLQNQSAAAGIRIYPNPATSTVYITSAVNVRAVVTSIDGKTQLEQPNAKEINISRLADGMYFITLYNDEHQALTIQKILKQ